jgi:hypothetical protein
MAVPMSARGDTLESGVPQKFLVNTVIDNSDNAPLEVTLNWTALTK